MKVLGSNQSSPVCIRWLYRVVAQRLCDFFVGKGQWV